jgi:hypothetical protein
VRHLSALEEFRVTDLAPVDLARGPAWRLPRLRVLAWRAGTRVPLAPALAFLARCELPALRVLALSGPPLADGDGAALATFASTLAPDGLECLDLTGFPDDALAVCFPSLPTARLVVRCDHLAGLGCARPVLAPQLVVETFYATTRLLPALDDLLRRTATRRGAVRSVVLSMRLAQREAFAWDAPASVFPEHARFVGSLLSRAAALRECGIQLVDQRGLHIPVRPPRSTSDSFAEQLADGRGLWPEATRVKKCTARAMHTRVKLRTTSTAHSCVALILVNERTCHIGY